jgi:hypothetical protein
MLRAFRRRLRGHTCAYEDPPRLPPVSRCTWLRAVGSMRRRYFAAQGGAPSLPWFEGAASQGLRLHVTAHVRRGDIWQRDRSRHVSNERWGRALLELAGALAEVRALWAGAPLAISVHLMTQKSRSDEEPPQ